jgi:hypothetical protein
MEHSGCGLMNAASMLPQSVFSYWSNVAGFMNSSAQSAGAISSVFTTKKPQMDEAGLPRTSGAYGTTKAVETEVDKLIAEYLFNQESMKGGNEEALLLLKKDPSISWGACEDYVAYTKTLNRREKERQTAGGERAKLKVRLYFAESDVMIGKKGQKFFEECWRSNGDSDMIDLESSEMPGTNHDSVLVDFEKGALERIFKEIKALS